MATPEAFLLLTIPNAKLKAENVSLTGTVALQCVTIPVPSASSQTNRDVYLVLRLDSYEIPLDPARVVDCTLSTAGERTYIFHGSDFDPTELQLSVSSLVNGRDDPALSEDLETFEQIIAQYANFRSALSSPPKPAPASPSSDGESADLRGRLVIVNQDSGEVIGEVDTDRKLNIREDPKLNERGRESDVVVIDVPDVREGLGTATAHDPLQVYVDVIPPGQEDWLIKSATGISYAISSTTNLILTAITSASSYYIAHSTPAPPAPRAPPIGMAPPRKTLVFLSSEQARKGLSTVHAMSGQAVQVSSRTVSTVDKMIRKAMGGRSRGPIPMASPIPTYPPGPASFPSPLRSGDPNLPPPPYHTLDGKYSVPPRAPSPLPPMPPPLPRLRKRERALISADLILSTLEQSAQTIIDVGGERLSAAVGHKYGPVAAENTRHVTGTAKNVALVYIDMRGIGRRALLRKAGKELVTTQLRSR